MEMNLRMVVAAVQEMNQRMREWEERLDKIEQRLAEIEKRPIQVSPLMTIENGKGDGRSMAQGRPVLTLRGSG